MQSFNSAHTGAQIDDAVGAVKGTGNGLVVKTGTGTGVKRSIAGTADQITVTNADGVAGNPTLALATSVVTTLGKANTAVQPDDLATVATSGSYNDLTDKPSVVVSYNDLTDKPTFATVATSGAYSDLTGTPTLGTAASTNSTAYATAAQGTKADKAVPSDITGITGASAITNMVSLSQSSYNSASKNNSTLYIVNDSNLYLGSNLLTWDSDARAWISAVERADNALLETAVKRAMNELVSELKRRNLWPQIEQCGVFCGARTLSGALIPLKGRSPANFNFVTADLNRKLGLKGDGSTKYLDTQRNALTKDKDQDVHIYGFMTELAAGDNTIIGVETTSQQKSLLRITNPSPAGANLYRGTGHLRNRFAIDQDGTKSFVDTFVNRYEMGISASRQNQATFLNFGSVFNTSISFPETASDGTYFLFANNLIGTGANSFNAGRIAFYSIGTNLNANAMLDFGPVIASYVNALKAAIV